MILTKIGMICDLGYKHHIGFTNCYYALINLFGNIKIINGIDDIRDVDLIFIANDHWAGHRKIWENDSFIKECNNLNIRLVVFTEETIMSPYFTWNVDIQKNLEKFNDLYQYVIDVDDALVLNKKLMRSLISIKYKDFIKPKDKIDGCVFMGKYKGFEYAERQKILSSINKIIKVDVIESIPRWEDYIEKLSEYRFVLSPSSNGNFFPLRFYEILLVNSIPIHQVKHNTLKYHQIESKFEDCIYFQTIDELTDKLSNFKLKESYNKIWLEDHIEDLIKTDNILFGNVAAPSVPVLPFFDSELNYVILPEIKDDVLYYLIQELARTERVSTVLEIGSSAGGGSTEAFVNGLSGNPHGAPRLFCMEVSKPRYAELAHRYADKPFVKCYNTSSVLLKGFPSPKEVEAFYHSTKTSLNNYPLERVLGWLTQDIDYVRTTGVDEDGIERIKRENGIDCFDMVLIDGSEFTGKSELDKVYGARIILLDDINSFKNYANYQQLTADPDYDLMAENWKIRNGYAVFKKKEVSLPIHFFTIVLNGEPLIRHHIDIFRQLSFKWHWHIVEGVADLKHDTGWSLQFGGKITDELHRNGLSNDGTTEYLNELVKQFPENITIYRKPAGTFWDGKLEMVNAPLVNIREECLLWQVDSDELWTTDQLVRARQMFLDSPARTAAYYWCWFFVGDELVISTRNCYAENPAYEWLRTWRYRPGFRWAAHEPPRLAEPVEDAQWRDVALVNPFRHEVTESEGLVFQHFAYVAPEQLRFKELYYGYSNAVANWQRLQSNMQFPVPLRNYFPWVHDDTLVDRSSTMGIRPLARPRRMFDLSGRNVPCQPLHGDLAAQELISKQQPLSKIVVDGVIFQLQEGREGGISRVWKALLDQLSNSPLAGRIVLLDRGETAPTIPGIVRAKVSKYDFKTHVEDSKILDSICAELNAGLFISTYYSWTNLLPTIIMLHDMTPEILGWDLSNPEWQSKRSAIAKASHFLSVSNATLKDFRMIYPNESLKQVAVITNAASNSFCMHDETAVKSFKDRISISKPYFLIVGQPWSHKNLILFFKAFSRLPKKDQYEIVVSGGSGRFQQEFSNYLDATVCHEHFFTDLDLSIAYSGAIALVYPSLYEGFGLPPLEAMQSGCPVITCRNSSIPEVVGEAALYVGESDVDGMIKALIKVQQKEVRTKLIESGQERAKLFSWEKSGALLVGEIEKIQHRIDAAPERFKELQTGSDSPSAGYLVSAIVSAYNSERFIRGCIEDLEAQTIADKLEIVIVDSFSPQNERAVVEEFQKKYPNIKYIRTETRETVYAAWNRGIKASSGKYITNANTDDRHRHDAFQVMVNELERKPEIVLVYADVIMTEKENETFDLHTPCGNFKWHDWDRSILLEKGCFMGPQPMWRRSVHDEYGYFDESMVTSGDYEFWLRISQTHNFYHITTQLGLYLKSPESIEHKNREKQREENQQILSLYRDAAKKARVIKSEVVKGIPALTNPEFIEGLTSIIIPVQSIHLDECILSIKKYTDKPHEIIFLDHGAAPKLKKQIAKALKENRTYKVIKIDRKVNFAQSLNEGINQSTGEYIVLLFDDVFVGEGWHSDMLECLHGGKKVGIVGAMSNDASNLQRVEGIDFISPEKRLSFRERNRHRRINTRNLDGFCLLFRRDLLIQIDLFDEIFGADKHVFDDFCVRAVLEGYNNVIAGNVFVHNRGGINRLLSRDKTLFDEKWIGLDASTLLAEKVLIANSIELASSQYHKGDIVDAVKTLIERIGFFPNERRLFYQIAEILLAENKFQEALDALKGMVPAEDDAEYYALLGYGNEGLGLYKVADDYVDKALAIDDKSALALNLKGILAYKKDEIGKAEEYFRRAIEADSGFGEPYTNIGMLKWKVEQKEEAVDLFEKGFILSPDKGDIITGYYNAVSSLERYARAENIFREARTVYPENKRILFLLIDIFLKQEKFPEAMQEVEKAMVQFGMDTGILSAALEIRRKIGAKTIAIDGGKAKAAPTLSVCMIVKNEENHLAYCLNSLSPVADEMIVVDTGSTDKTKEIAEAFGARVFDIEWTNDFAVARNHSLSKAQGDWILVMDADEVISFQDYAKLKKLISKKDKIAYNLITRNYITRTAGDGWTCNDNTYIHEQAGRGWFPSGKVRLFPNNEKIRFENPIHELVEYSIMRIGMGKQESGIPVHHYGELDAKKATEKDAQYYELGVKKMKESGGDFKSVWELAVQAGELGKTEESIELWHKVLGFKQREATAYFNLANHYLKLGKHEDSYDCSKKSYALDPKDQSAVLSYSMSEFLAGDINKTISVLEGFLKGTDTQSSHVGLLAVSYFLTGEKDRGLKYLRGLVKKKYNCVYYFKDLAQSLIAAGNFARAKSLLTSAIEIKFYDQQTSALLAQCEANVGRVTAPGE